MLLVCSGEVGENMLGSYLLWMEQKGEAGRGASQEWRVSVDEVLERSGVDWVDSKDGLSSVSVLSTSRTVIVECSIVIVLEGQGKYNKFQDFSVETTGRNDFTVIGNCCANALSLNHSYLPVPVYNLTV